MIINKKTGGKFFLYNPNKKILKKESAVAAPATAPLAQPTEPFALNAMPPTSYSPQPAMEFSTLVSHAVAPTIISLQPSQMEAESADSAKTQ